MIRARLRTPPQGEEHGPDRGWGFAAYGALARLIMGVAGAALLIVILRGLKILK